MMRVRTWLLSGALVGLLATPGAAQQPDQLPSCSGPQVEAASLWCQGGALFLKGEYAKALKPYERALALERQHRQLGRTAWRILVDNLSIAYGVGGAIAESRQVLEYGITLDPDYPMFYYNLACGYAEEENASSAIHFLQLAFARRANVIATETMPDPWTDDSFQRFMRNADFTSELAKIVPKPGGQVAQESDKAVTLTITEAAGQYVLAVPVSRLVMTIPKGSLRIAPTAVGGATGSPRYFSFASESPALIITGWFESADGFSTIQAFWTAETGAWTRQHLPTPQDVSFVQIGRWNAVLYDLPVPVGRETNIRAHWVQGDTWIDIHLSLTDDLSSRELRSRLRAELESITVTQKSSQE